MDSGGYSEKERNGRKFQEEGGIEVTIKARQETGLQSKFSQ